MAVTRRAATFILALYVAGMVAHVGHHLLDPHCDEASGPLSHPCVACAALHGGIELQTQAEAPAPERTVGQHVVALTTTLFAATPRGLTLSRAPPLG